MYIIIIIIVCTYIVFNMYDVSAQGVDERMINVHYYYYCVYV